MLYWFLTSGRRDGVNDFGKQFKWSFVLMEAYQHSPCGVEGAVSLIWLTDLFAFCGHWLWYRLAEPVHSLCMV